MQYVLIIMLFVLFGSYCHGYFHPNRAIFRLRTSIAPSYFSALLGAMKAESVELKQSNGVIAMKLHPISLSVINSLDRLESTALNMPPPVQSKVMDYLSYLRSVHQGRERIRKYAVQGFCSTVGEWVKWFQFEDIWTIVTYLEQLNAVDVGLYTALMNALRR